MPGVSNFGSLSGFSAFPSSLPLSTATARRATSVQNLGLAAAQRKSADAKPVRFSPRWRRGVILLAALSLVLVLIVVVVGWLVLLPSLFRHSVPPGVPNGGAESLQQGGSAWAGKRKFTRSASLSTIPSSPSSPTAFMGKFSLSTEEVACRVEDTHTVISLIATALLFGEVSGTAVDVDDQVVLPVQTPCSMQRLLSCLHRHGWSQKRVSHQLQLACVYTCNAQSSGASQGGGVGVETEERVVHVRGLFSDEGRMTFVRCPYPADYSLGSCGLRLNLLDLPGGGIRGGKDGMVQDGLESGLLEHEKLETVDQEELSPLKLVQLPLDPCWSEQIPLLQAEWQQQGQAAATIAAGSSSSKPLDEAAKSKIVSPKRLVYDALEVEGGVRLFVRGVQWAVEHKATLDSLQCVFVLPHMRSDCSVSGLYAPQLRDASVDRSRSSSSVTVGTFVENVASDLAEGKRYDEGKGKVDYGVLGDCTLRVSPVAGSEDVILCPTPPLVVELISKGLCCSNIGWAADRNCRHADVARFEVATGLKVTLEDAFGQFPSVAQYVPACRSQAQGEGWAPHAHPVLVNKKEETASANIKKESRTILKDPEGEQEVEEAANGGGGAQPEEEDKEVQESYPEKRKPERRRNFLCSCTMLWDEARFMREWTIFHTWMGVEKFFVYDNNSDDDLAVVAFDLSRTLRRPLVGGRRAPPGREDQVTATQQGQTRRERERMRMRRRLVQESYRGKGNSRVGVNPGDSTSEGQESSSDKEMERVSVEVYPWPWPKAQESAFSHCLLRAERECEWTMFLDHDEFLMPTPETLSEMDTREALNEALNKRPGQPFLHRIINDIVDSYSSPYVVGQIVFDSLTFGPSGHTTPPVEGVLTGYTCRLSERGTPKAVVRAGAARVDYFNWIHSFMLGPGYAPIPSSQTSTPYGGFLAHYKFEAWADYLPRFHRRCSAKVKHWLDPSMEEQVREDGVTLVGGKPVPPEDWAHRFCEVNETSVCDFVRVALGGLESSRGCRDTQSLSGLLPWMDMGRI